MATEAKEPLWKRIAIGIGGTILILFFAFTMVKGCTDELWSWKALFGIETSPQTEAEIAYDGLPDSLTEGLPIAWERHWTRGSDGSYRFVGKARPASATLYYGMRVEIRNGRYERGDWTFIEREDYERHLAEPSPK